MKKSIDDKVIYCESSVDNITKNLIDKGYRIADSRGVYQHEPYTDVIGILKPRKPIQKKFLGFKYNKRQNTLFIGRLWLENINLGATLDEKWVLEIYGKEYVPELTDLAKELSKLHQTRITMLLRNENPEMERVLWIKEIK